MTNSAKDQLKETLRDDDYVDYVILIALIFLAVFGAYMWQKLRDQQKTLLL